MIAIDGVVQGGEAQEGEATARSEGHKHPDKWVNCLVDFFFNNYIF